MKYRVIHDCDGYRIQKSLFGFIWFDSADAYFYGCVGGKLGEFTIPLKHTFNHKEDAIETAKRLKFRLRYKGHLIRADKNYYVDLSSYNWFEGYSNWSKNLNDVKKKIDEEIWRKKNRKNVEVFLV